jgi:catabolite regulation protein CreA
MILVKRTLVAAERRRKVIVSAAGRPPQRADRRHRAKWLRPAGVVRDAMTELRNYNADQNVASGYRLTLLFLSGARHRPWLRQHDVQFVVAERQGVRQRLWRPAGAGVACHISQARKGGWGQPLGLNEDPSNFSISCRQVGPIDVDLSKLGAKDEVFSQKTSIFFKTTRIYRLIDKPHNTLIYLAISTKIVNGSPATAISTVPITPWQH